MRRSLLLAAALAVPLSGVTTLALGGTAWAGTKIVCSTITGTESGGSTISGCSGGNTGGSSLPGLALASGATINWASGKSTTLGNVAFAIKPGKKCPGYSKTAAANPSVVKFSAPVTSDTGTGIKVPGKASGEICLSLTGNITSLKPLKIS
jgi:hypothetical protein